MASDRLTELVTTYPVLSNALRELTEHGDLANVTADAMGTDRVPRLRLGEFFACAARVLPRERLPALARRVPEFIHRRGVGQDTLDHLMEHGGLNNRELWSVAHNVGSKGTPETMLWWHPRVLRLAERGIVNYDIFLTDNLDLVLTNHAEQMTAYLMHPDRGPSDYIVHCFDMVIARGGDRGQFLERWHEWIRDGAFDTLDQDGLPNHTHPIAMYEILNKRGYAPPYDRLRAALYEHILALMQSPESRSAVILHIDGMWLGNYRDSVEVIRLLQPYLPDLAPAVRDEFQNRLTRLRTMLATLR